MNAFATQAVSACEQAGRQAFRAHGVTGELRHSFPEGSPQQIAFQSGFWMERGDACERAMAEARAYHDLCVRDGAKDREWAEKLAGELNARPAA